MKEIAHWLRIRMMINADIGNHLDKTLPLYIEKKGPGRIN